MSPIIRTEFDLGGPRQQMSSGEQTARRTEPFHLLVLGDLRGSAQPREIISQRKLQTVDRDNLEEVFARLAVEVQLSGCGSAIRLGFMDDFHPDALVERLPPFEQLNNLRRRLLNPSTFAAAAAEMGHWAKQQSAQNVESVAEASEGGSLLEQLLRRDQQSDRDPALSRQDPLGRDQIRSQAYGQNPAGDDATQMISRLVQAAVAPYVIPAAHPDTESLVKAVDASSAALLRGILHDHQFAALEARWRGIEFLTSRIDTDANVKIHLLDLSELEWHADLDATDDLQQTQLFRLLERYFSGAGGQPLGLVVADYNVQGTVDEALLLTKMAIIMEAFGAAFLCSGAPGIAGCRSFKKQPDSREWRDERNQDDRDSWEAFRQLEEANRIGICAPRVMWRQPYGRKSSPIDAFAFEEQESPPRHGLYAWGSSAFLAAAAIAEGVAEQGWQWSAGSFSKIHRMPLHVYDDQGDTEVTPATEAYLPETSVKHLYHAGFCVVQSVRNEDAVQIDGIRSCAADGALLQGGWQG